LDTRFRGYDGTPVVETLPLHVFSKKASDYLRRQMRDGRIYVGFDVDDDGLGFAVQKAGRDAVVFGSDFPHEVFNAEKCRHEIDQLLARGDLDSADKAAVLGGNARRFYRLGANGR
ncbi:MAG: amidohydrolase family protein, partial [Candidatus Binatia bacterium]